MKWRKMTKKRKKKRLDKEALCERLILISSDLTALWNGEYPSTLDQPSRFKMPGHLKWSLI